MSLPPFFTSHSGQEADFNSYFRETMAPYNVIPLAFSCHAKKKKGNLFHFILAGDKLSLI